MAAMGALLTAGYVLLAGLGRDTTGYVLFLGGPAMTSIVGAVLTRRLSHVQRQVTTVQAAAAVALDEEAGAIHQHLSAQDEQLAHLTEAVVGEPPAAPAAVAGTSAPGGQLPSQRTTDPLTSPWPIAQVGRRKGV